MKYYTVYKITNTINNKIYIGEHETTSPYDSYMGSGTIIKLAHNKYGLSQFKKEINQEEVLIVINEFISRSDTYNILLMVNGLSVVKHTHLQQNQK